MEILVDFFLLLLHAVMLTKSIAKIQMIRGDQ
jgi:hypothetical protein